MRLNQYISSSGLCSRREADTWIVQGRVKVNGQLAILGQQVDENDIVEVNGQVVTVKQEKVYLAFNKPSGITSTTDRTDKDNIVDYIKYKDRIFPIGRLDKDSEGLILLTNDGSIVNDILDEANEHEKDYIVKVNKIITDDFLHAMAQGVEIYNPVKNEYTTTKPAIVEQINNRTFKITLTQGLNRQIRRMCTKLGYHVYALRRVRIMHIELEDLKLGTYRHLTHEELDTLFKALKKVEV